MTSHKKRKRWLTLKEAANMLGIHPATLRAWADEGAIPSFRTRGGHRRFAVEDIQAFLEEHTQGKHVLAQREDQRIVTRALDVTRNRLPHARQGAAWYEAFDEATRERKRQQGRLLFSLALQYVSKPEEREHILERARELGEQYGEDSVRFGVSLVDTLRAIFFFKQALLDTLEANGNVETGQTPANVRVTRGVEEFINEVLYATAGAYERAMRHALDFSPPWLDAASE